MNARLSILILVFVGLAIGCLIRDSHAVRIELGPYLQNVTQTGVTVVWETDVPSDSRVSFTPTGGAAGSAYDATPAQLHQIRLTGLAPDTVYTYQVAATTQSSFVTGASGSFRTAPRGDSPFRFAVYGDTRSQPAVHAQVAAAIAGAAPRLVLYTGDLSDDDTSDSTLRSQFFTPAQPLLQNAPLYPCLGNHEYDASRYYLDFASLPQGGGLGGVEWYSFDYGNMHVAVLDTNTDYSPGSPQYQWLVSDLANAHAEWRFVVQHHPAYSSGEEGPTPAVQEYLVPLYERYHVDVVFAGHDHLYERSLKDGVNYIVTGGGGAPLYPIDLTPNPFQQYAQSVYHYVTADVSGDTAVFQAHSIDGSVFDSLTLTHAPPPPPPPPPPVADFSAAPTRGLAPLTVAFTDVSTGRPTSWSWDFGDGITSNQQNPLHTYAAAGSYTVSFTVANGASSATETKPDYIVALLPPTVASFTYAPVAGVAPVEVHFADTSTHDPYAWLWSFGDGGSSTLQNPTHTYPVVGRYTVSLTASNAAGSDTAVRPDGIAVGAAPAVDFTGTPWAGIAPLAVVFRYASPTTPTWAPVAVSVWSFGDGATSGEASPVHVYAKPGLYDVSLTLTNDFGVTTAVKPHGVAVTFPDVPVQPSFWALHEILSCVDAALVAGYPDGLYHPGEAVSRDQMAVYISRALAGGDAKVPSAPATASFTDVPTSYWAFQYIEYAERKGVVLGYTPTQYAPTLPVTRDQMAVFTARSIVTPTGEAGMAGYTPPSTPDFSDVPTSFWAYKYIEYIRGQGITGGYPDGLYHSEVVVTRDQMAVYLARAFELPR